MNEHKVKKSKENPMYRGKDYDMRKTGMENENEVSRRLKMELYALKLKYKVF